MKKIAFSKDVLQIDPAVEVERICRWMRQVLGRVLRKRGVVVAISGGIDSSVTLGLAAKAVGKQKVLALMMPERDSAPDTLRLSEIAAQHFGCPKMNEDITEILASAGHYRRYNEAAEKVVPGFGEGWKSKLETSKLSDDRGVTFFNFVARSPENHVVKERLPLQVYLEVVAATSFKQRTRKMLEYYHADRLNYAVAGTPNRLEYDQGFFVKQGDGTADIKPIAHLYKSQVYQIAECIGVPPEIIERPPTTDTYSLAQSQDEFYFAVSYDKMDLCLYGKNHGIGAAEIAEAAGLAVDQVENIYEDIDRKRSTTRYLHLPAMLVENIPEIMT